MDNTTASILVMVFYPLCAIIYCWILHKIYAPQEDVNEDTNNNCHHPQ